MRKTSIEARFYLKEPSSSQPTLIYLRVNGGTYTIRLKYSTGLKITPSDWNFDTQRAFTRSKSLQDKQVIKDINLQLERYDMAVSEIISSCINAGQVVTQEIIKTRLDAKPELHLVRWKKPKSEITRSENLLDFISQFLSEATEGKRLIPETGKKYALNTIKSFQGTMKYLQSFNQTTRYKLTFDALNERFYQHLSTYLIASNLSQNSIGNVTKNLKTLLALAYKEGYHQNRSYEGFKARSESTTAVYLTLDDLDKLYRLDLSNRKALDRTRDLFLVGCYTGLRFSDWNKVLPENLKEINGQMVLKVRPTKTDMPVAIPVRSNLATILSKYGGQLPAPVSNQKTNFDLKEIMKLAGIDESITISRTIGGIRSNEVLYKSELVSTHTARRTFATLAILGGVADRLVMKMTGHKSEASFRRYLRMEAEEVAVLLASHDHFKPHLKEAN